MNGTILSAAEPDRADTTMATRRLGRSLPHLLTIASELQDRGVERRTLTGGVAAACVAWPTPSPPFKPSARQKHPSAQIARNLGISRSSV